MRCSADAVKKDDDKCLNIPPSSYSSPRMDDISAQTKNRSVMRQSSVVPARGTTLGGMPPQAEAWG